MSSNVYRLEGVKAEAFWNTGKCLKKTSCHVTEAKQAVQLLELELPERHR